MAAVVSDRHPGVLRPPVVLAALLRVVRQLRPVPRAGGLGTLRHGTASVLAVLSLALGGIAGSADGVAAALADAQKLPPELRAGARYLSLHGVPVKDRVQFLKVLAFQANSLSRDPDLYPLFMVTPALARVNLIDYGWSREVWEKLAVVDPYYHLQEFPTVRAVEVPVVPAVVPVAPAVALPAPAPVVKAPVPEPPAGRRWNHRKKVFLDGGRSFIWRVSWDGVDWYDDADQTERGGAEKPQRRERVSYDGGRTWVWRVHDGRQWREERPEPKAEARPEPEAKPETKVEPKPAAKEKQAATLHAPWLPSVEIAALALAVNSDAPILRADWFFYWTAQAKDRKGAGYYDFLGIKSRADLQKLVALDIEASKRLRYEWAAIVAESGVALNNRQILRFKSLTGGYWATLDANTNEDKRNAVRVLNGDFKHDAEELYVALPNQLFGYAASNANGELQETVPDTIAADHVSTGNDRRIHVPLGCVRCHEEGLRPIDDWARKVYSGPVALASPDYAKLKRLRQLYLSDLPGELETDVRAYARALKKVNGLTPKENARAYAQAWQRFAETSLGLPETAAELGVDIKTWENALKTYGRLGNADPVLMGLLAKPSARIRREHWAEVFGAANVVLKSGVKP